MKDEFYNADEVIEAFNNGLDNMKSKAIEMLQKKSKRILFWQEVAWWSIILNIIFIVVFYLTFR